MVTFVYWVSGIHCEGCCNFMLTRGSSKELFFSCFLSPGPHWTEVGLNNRCGTKAVQRGTNCQCQEVTGTSWVEPHKFPIHFTKKKCSPLARLTWVHLHFHSQRHSQQCLPWKMMISNGIQDESAPKIVDYYDVTEAAWSSSVTNLPCLIACRRENASGVACLFHKREIAVKHVGEVDMIGRKHPKTLNHLLSCQMYILYHYTVWLFKQTVLVWDPGVGSVFVSPSLYKTSQLSGKPSSRNKPKELGQGSFGTAYVGHYRSNGMQCAVPRRESVPVARRWCVWTCAMSFFSNKRKAQYMNFVVVRFFLKQYDDNNVPSVSRYFNSILC